MSDDVKAAIESAVTSVLYEYSGRFPGLERVAQEFVKAVIERPSLRELEAQLTPPEPVQAGEYRDNLKPFLLHVLQRGKQLAELALKDGLNETQQYVIAEHWAEQLEADAHRIAAAMNEETADETPIDEEWLKSLGFGSMAKNQWRLSVVVVYLDPIAIGVAPGTGADRWWQGQNTRGQLRTLCKALGIPLPPSAHAEKASEADA